MRILIFRVRGRGLDRLARYFGLPPRRRRWWLFRESDQSFRLRMQRALYAMHDHGPALLQSRALN